MGKGHEQANEGRVSQTTVRSREHPSKAVLEGRIRNEVMYELLREWRIFSPEGNRSEQQLSNKIQCQPHMQL